MIFCQRIHVFPLTSSNVPNIRSYTLSSVTFVSLSVPVRPPLKLQGRWRCGGRWSGKSWTKLLQNGGSMTWKIHEAPVASHLRDGITGIYLVLTYHTPRKFKPGFSDDMIQHGIVLDKAMHGIYATWVTQTYLSVLLCLLHEWRTDSSLSPLVCINCLLYPYAHYIGSDLLHLHDRTSCFNLVPKHARYFTFMFWRCFWNLNLVSKVSVHFHHWAENWLLGLSELFMAKLVKGMIFLCCI